MARTASMPHGGIVIGSGRTGPSVTAVLDDLRPLAAAS
jgi:hypothetical protein